MTQSERSPQDSESTYRHLVPRSLLAVRSARLEQLRGCWFTAQRAPHARRPPTSFRGVPLICGEPQFQLQKDTAENVGGAVAHRNSLMIAIGEQLARSVERLVFGSECSVRPKSSLRDLFAEIAHSSS